MVGGRVSRKEIGDRRQETGEGRGTRPVRIITIVSVCERMCVCVLLSQIAFELLLGLRLLQDTFTILISRTHL